MGDRVQHKGMLIFTVCLTAVVIGLLIFGISRHTEPTFQRACATEPSGIADYKGDCFDVRWAKLPVLVSSNGDADQREALAYAMRGVNRDLRRTALRAAEPGEAAQAVFLFNAAPLKVMPHPGAVTTHYFRDGLAVRSETRVINVVLYGIIDGILRHELGHVLGFEDDPYRGVMMSYPTDIGKPLSDYDVKAFRAVYGGAR